MKIGPQPEKRLRKKARQGGRGYPIGTVAFYGPDNRRATKAAVAVIRSPNSDPELRRWFSEVGDVRTDSTVLAEIVIFLREQSARSVAMTEGIIGCPRRGHRLSNRYDLSRLSILGGIDGPIKSIQSDPLLHCEGNREDNHPQSHFLLFAGRPCQRRDRDGVGY